MKELVITIIFPCYNVVLICFLSFSGSNEPPYGVLQLRCASTFLLRTVKQQVAMKEQREEESAQPTAYILYIKSYYMDNLIKCFHFHFKLFCWGLRKQNLCHKHRNTVLHVTYLRGRLMLSGSCTGDCTKMLEWNTHALFRHCWPAAWKLNRRSKYKRKSVCVCVCVCVWLWSESLLRSCQPHSLRVRRCAEAEADTCDSSLFNLNYSFSAAPKYWRLI